MVALWYRYNFSIGSRGHYYSEVMPNTRCYSVVDKTIDNFLTCYSLFLVHGVSINFSVPILATYGATYRVRVRGHINVVLPQAPVLRLVLCVSPYDSTRTVIQLLVPSRPPRIKNSDCAAITSFRSSLIAKEAAAMSLQMERVFFDRRGSHQLC